MQRSLILFLTMHLCIRMRHLALGILPMLKCLKGNCRRFGPGGVPGPTSKFVAACPCPDGLAQDGTQGRNAAHIISHQGVCS
jgi:hypothetical protein